MSISSHQEKFLRRGEALYTQGLDDALDEFRKVILLCDCNKTLRASSKRLGISSKDIPLPVCHCKDYLSLPIDDPTSGSSDKEAVFRLSTQPCSCGSGLKPCHNPAHIKALTNIANVYVAQKAYNKAVQHASLAITLAPHAPEGYLRLVTVLRQGGLQCTPDLASRCNWLDTQASHSVRAHGDKNHELLQYIGRRIRRDILQGVPVEIRQMILRYLSQVDICRAMQVSRVWRRSCQDPQLWRDLKLVKNWRQNRTRCPFRPGALKDLVMRSGHMATSLTIDGLWDFKFDADKLRAMLKALPKLKFLSLAGRRTEVPPGQLQPFNPDVPQFQEFWDAVWFDSPETLTTLQLSMFDVNYAPDLRRYREDPDYQNRDEAAMCWSLTDLSLSRLNGADVYLILDTVRLATLTNLNVRDCEWGGESCDITNYLDDLFYVSAMVLDGVMLDRRASGSFLQWRSDCDFLKRLVLGKVQFEGGIKFPTSEELRTLELNDDGLNLAKLLMLVVETEPPFLPMLGHFRCHFDPHSAHIQQLYDQHLLDEHEPLLAMLRPSIGNGNLFSLDLTFSKEIRTAVDKLYQDDQKQAIRILSCHEIVMPSIVSGYGGNCDEFLDWVETFPNLTTIGAYPQMCDHAHMLISWLMDKRPDVKTIYTNVLRGAGRDRVLAEAAKRDVTLFHADRVPEPLELLDSQKFKQGKWSWG